MATATTATSLADMCNELKADPAVRLLWTQADAKEKAGKHDEASEFFSQALQKCGEQHGNTDARLAELWYKYASSLVRVAQSQSELAGLAGSPTTPAAASQPSSAAAAPAVPPTAEGEGEQEPDGDTMRAAVEEQRVENLEIAWESLEAAVQLFQSMPTSAELRLRIADAQVWLGEIQMENEVSTGALEDYSKALGTYTELLPKHDSRLAEVNSNLATAWLHASSVPELPAEERLKALAVALSHMRGSGKHMMDHILHLVAADPALAPGAGVIQATYDKAVEMVKGEPGSKPQAVGTTQGAGAPKQLPLADQLPSLAKAWGEWAASASIGAAASGVGDRCSIVDATLQRAADVVSDDPAEAPDNNDVMSKLLAALSGQGGEEGGDGVTTIGFGAPAAPISAPPAPAGNDTSGLAAMLGTPAPAPAPTDVSGLAAMLGGGAPVVGTLAVRKKKPASVGGGKRPAEGPAPGQEAPKKAAGGQ